MRLGVVSLALLAVGLPACGGDSDAVAAADLDAVEAEAARLHEVADHEQSAAAYARAAELAEAAGDARRANAMRAQRAVCLKMLGRLTEARDALEDALTFARETGDRRTEGLALGNLSKVEALEGNEEQSLEYLDALVEVASSNEDPRLEVWTLEQAAVLAAKLGRLDGAVERFDRALARNAGTRPEDDRGPSLMRQKAWTLAALRDDEGAADLWSRAPKSGAGLANQARHLSDLGLHELAANVAAEAVAAYEADGDQQVARDAALALRLSELILAGRSDECRSRLEAILERGGDPVAEAPFRVLRARLALAQGDAAGAAEELRDARTHLDGELDERAGWLLAHALVEAGEPGAARDVLAALPPNLAVTVLRASSHLDDPPTDALSGESLPGLDPDALDVGDASLANLQRLLPGRLPSLSWLTLHLALADSDRLRVIGRADLAEGVVRAGIVDALRWQTLEAMAEVLGRWPEPASVVTPFARVEEWVDGRLDPEEGIIVPILGSRLSYLVLCTSDLGGTTFGLGPAETIAGRVRDVVDALRSGELSMVAAESFRLFETLFGEGAQEDLEGRSRWTFVLDDVLSPVPPSMLVTESPSPTAMPAWLVMDRVVRVLPHAPTRTDLSGRSGWHVVGEAGFEAHRARLVPQLFPRYGTSALSVGPLRASVDPDEARVGEQATVSAVVELAATAETLELSVAGLGGGRLGGLLLTPDGEAARGDARIGFLPWHRLAELTMPPFLVLDRTRFDPGEVEFGAAYAATAALLGGSHSVLVARWPQPAQVRDTLLEGLSSPELAALPWPDAVARAQRAYLAFAAARGPELAHPRAWAGWIVFGGP